MINQVITAPRSGLYRAACCHSSVCRPSCVTLLSMFR